MSEVDSRVLRCHDGPSYTENELDLEEDPMRRRLAFSCFVMGAACLLLAAGASVRGGPGPAFAATHPAAPVKGAVESLRASAPQAGNPCPGHCAGASAATPVSAILPGSGGAVEGPRSGAPQTNPCPGAGCLATPTAASLPASGGGGSGSPGTDAFGLLAMVGIGLIAAGAVLLRRR